MQEELKRSNTIGDLKGIKHFADTILKSDKIQIETARQICSFINGIRLNFNSALAFFQYLQLIDITGTSIVPTSSGIKFYFQLEWNFEKNFCEICLNRIIEDEIIRFDAFKFDTIKGRYYIQKHGFPLNAAIFRNVLIQLRALTEQSNGTFLLSEIHEKTFAKTNKIAKQNMSLEKLKEQLLRQNEQGESSELFVLEYELERLKRTANKIQIKRISEIDVGAGYDIVSYENDESQEYDRFIEVKSYYGNLHFYWSANEIKIASSLGDKYYIYLVDAEKISEKNYQPIIIRDPANAVLNTDSWLMQPTSYFVLPVDAASTIKNFESNNQ